MTTSLTSRPDRAVGAVLVEGAQPYDWFDESMEPPARNPNIKIHAKVASSHSSILRKDFRTVAAAVRDAA